MIQRVKTAKVEVGGETVGKIEKGFLVLLGVMDGDTEKEADLLAAKTAKLRIFEDENEKMNFSLADIGGGLLIISQFTLFGNCKKGRRPDFTSAGNPEIAKAMYEKFIDYCQKSFKNVKSGIFGADMKVDLENDGPVTLIIDSKN